MLRDHQPIVIEDFRGLFKRGDADSVPSSYFEDCENIQFIESGFKTRDGIDTYRAISNPVRIYNYTMQEGESLLVLDNNGDIYHVFSEFVDTAYLILSIPEMTDFGFVSINGYAFITPFTTETDDSGVNYARGLEDEFVYVYKDPDGPARKAAGFPPVITDALAFQAFNSATLGVVDKGIHLIGVALDGGIVGPEVFQVVNAPGLKQIQLINIPILTAATSRTIVMTHAIDPKDYDPTATYTWYTALTISDIITVSASLNNSDAALSAVYVPGAGAAPVTLALAAKNTLTLGFNDFGFHLFGVVYETDSGYLTAPGPESFAGMTTVDITKAITITNIPISPDPAVVKRRLVATRAIPYYNGDQIGYQFFFIPEGDIDDNTTTTKTVSFFDSDLLEDASHLIDNFSEIPAGVGLTTYNGRMALYATHDDISICYLSAQGEPEAIDQVDGLLIVPLDGNPLTNGQEFRDVFYLFKKTRTVAYVDNNDDPSSWQMTIIDQGIGASVHGIGTVLDSGGVNIEYLLVVDFSGIMLFNGGYTRPELSYNIKDYWFELERNDFGNIQIMNDSLTQIIYITLPDGMMLIGDYSEGMNWEVIKWGKWRFDIEISTITFVDTNRLIIGSVGVVE